MEDKNHLFQAQHLQFQIHPSLAKQCHESAPDAVPVLFHCSKNTKLVVGRGHDATVQIGKTNKRVSREHVAIEHKAHVGFEMTILSPNGALIDHIAFDQGEHVPITEGTLIEIVGNKLVFAGSESTENLMVDLPPSPPTLATTVATETAVIVVEEEKIGLGDTESTRVPEFIPFKSDPSHSFTLEDQIIQVLGNL